MVRKNKEWLTLIPPTLAEKLVYNVMFNHNRTDVFYEYWLNSEHNWIGFISSGFSWVQSKEGENFWINVCGNESAYIIVTNKEIKKHSFI
jgi:hypothetical protein